MFYKCLNSYFLQLKSLFVVWYKESENVKKLKICENALFCHSFVATSLAINIQILPIPWKVLTFRVPNPGK